MTGDSYSGSGGAVQASLWLNEVKSGFGFSAALTGVHYLLELFCFASASATCLMVCSSFMLLDRTGTGIFDSSTPMWWSILVRGDAESVASDDCLLKGNFF